jgi:hypothetical protein
MNTRGEHEMLFYHFTQSQRLESIREQGLIPSSRSFGFEGNVDVPTPPYFPIVWLIQTQIKTASGVFVETVVKDVRITLALPIKNNKHLWHWATWLERYDPDYLRLLYADADATSHPGWAYYWFYTGVITPDKFRRIDANPVDRREVSDERRQELLARSAHNSRLIRSMLGRGHPQQENAADVSERVSTSPSKTKIRF